MKICSCGEPIRCQQIIDGKKRNLKNRTKCLKCLPFGHKTSKISIEQYRARKARNQRDCYNKHKHEYQRESTRRKEALVKLTNGCQMCGYNHSWNVAYHHCEGNKDFNIDKRQCQYSWDKVKPELLKCIAVCHNCHGDIHAGIVEEKLIKIHNFNFKLKIENLTDYPD